MEDYLQYMRTLRIQMNDVEDQAAKMSVEEQMQITTIHNLDKDLSSAKAENKRFKEETDQMAKTRGDICSKILENQKRIASLESDAFTLAQTLELLQQEKTNLSSKILERSAYYSKAVEDMTFKLQEQQDWLENKLQNEVIEEKSVQMDITEEISSEAHGVACNSGGEDKESLLKYLCSAEAKLDEVIHLKTKLISQNSEIKQTIDELNTGVNNLKTELKLSGEINLEEEQKACLSEKNAEREYLESLHNQIEKLKGISHVVKCGCGGECKVEVTQA